MKLVLNSLFYSSQLFLQFICESHFSLLRPLPRVLWVCEPIKSPDLSRTSYPLTSLSQIRVVLRDPRIDVPWSTGSTCKLDRHLRGISCPLCSEIVRTLRPRKHVLCPWCLTPICELGVPKGKGRFIEIGVDCQLVPLSSRPKVYPCRV